MRALAVGIALIVAGTVWFFLFAPTGLCDPLPADQESECRGLMDIPILMSCLFVVVGIFFAGLHFIRARRGR